MSANAEIAANAIATYLVEVGVLSINDQINAIRRQYAQTWRQTLARAGFDACHGMPVSDVADGVDLALSRLLEAAQAEYDVRDAIVAATGCGKSHAGTMLAKALQPMSAGGQ